MSAIRIIILSALITGAAIKGVPALAEPAAQPSDVAVSLVRTADLDLGSPKGQRELEQRITLAARDVCGTASDVDLEGKNQVRACRDEVIARAHSQRDSLLATAGRGATIAVTAGR